ncbi:MAG: cytochrome c5 family protein [Gammaproteobacteria bacterium]|nr:cytochrome c5 family protein [Gammaproteobacteria bacterium]
MSKEQDQLFFRNFSLIVGLLAVMMIIFIVVARIVGIDEAADAERRTLAVAEITAPMGEVSVAGDVGEAPEIATEVTAGGEGAGGKDVYDGLCISCHEPRIAQGNDTLYQRAIQGYTGNSGMMMPPRGGGADLSDDDVKAAVDYIVTNSQSSTGEVSKEEPEATVEVAAAAEVESAGDKGKKIYDGLCIACHGTGIPGTPQFGDKAAWEPRIAQGNDTLYQHAIQGFTGASGMMMLPRGGGADLSDDDVKAAVDYMVTNSQ